MAGGLWCVELPGGQVHGRTVHGELDFDKARALLKTTINPRRRAELKVYPEGRRDQATQIDDYDSLATWILAVIPRVFTLFVRRNASGGDDDEVHNNALRNNTPTPEPPLPWFERGGSIDVRVFNTLKELRDEIVSLPKDVTITVHMRRLRPFAVRHAIGPMQPMPVVWARLRCVIIDDGSEA